MSAILEKNRIKIYDSKGNLVEEREATLEDLKNAILNELANNYVFEFTFTLPTGETMKVRAKLEKVSR
jgi:hypothetical protein